MGSSSPVRGLVVVNVAVMAPSDMNGKWKLDHQDNFEDYLVKVGLGLMKRKVAINMTPTQEVSIEGDTVNIKNSLGSDVTFTVGVEFEHESPTGDKFKATGSWEGDKLITKATFKTGEEHVTVREVVGDEFIQTITLGDLVCKRVFKRC